MTQKTDFQLIQALEEGPATVYTLAAKLGYFWTSGLAKRLNRLVTEGKLERELSPERFYVYRVPAIKSTEQNQDATN
jgi:predicted transcriptional regulator